MCYGHGPQHIDVQAPCARIQYNTSANVRARAHSHDDRCSTKPIAFGRRGRDPVCFAGWFEAIAWRCVRDKRCLFAIATHANDVNPVPVIHVLFAHQRDRRRHKIQIHVHNGQRLMNSTEKL